MSRKRIAILGSTGSIGISALDVLNLYRDRFEVTGITAWGNASDLKKQIIAHRPKIAGIMDEEKAKELSRDPSLKGTKIVWGTEGLIEIAAGDDVDMVLSAIVGSAGLVPTYAAVEAGKDIALANKETLVAAGSIFMKEADRRGCRVFPVDSEHSAIFQSLSGQRKEDVKRLILTASGGPFRKKSRAELENVTAGDALNHPTWTMGSKITIDSATLMNKGLEVIEAKWLFDVPSDMIDVIIHPESIVHSMVEYVDGSVVAQLGMPDMKGPIAYALSYPERLDTGVKPLDLGIRGGLTFETPDTERFPALKLCYRALEMGGTAPAVASSANEIAVEAFLEEKIGFLHIPQIIEKVLSNHKATEPANIDDVLKADLWGRKEAKAVVAQMKREV